MGRSIAGTLGTILALSGAESHSTLTLTLVNATVLRFTTAVDPVTVEDQTFVPGLKMSGELRQTLGAVPDRTQATLDNVDKVAGLQLRAEDFIKAKVVVGRIYRTTSGSLHLATLFNGEAIPGMATETEVSLEILCDLTAGGYQLGIWTMAPTCGLKYKGPICGYTGSAATCAKTRRGPNGCQEHDVIVDDYKFGGWEYPDIQPAEPGAAPTGGGGGVIPPYDPCFPAGTLILMADFSEKPIELVRTGEFILTFADDWSLVPGRVGRLFHHKASADRFLSVDKGLITPTPNHGFYDPNLKRREIDQYRPGQYLRRLRGGSWIAATWLNWTIESLTWVDLREAVDTYNFEVEVYRRYIANRFAVSNRKGGLGD